MPVGRKEGKPLLRMLTGARATSRYPADLADAPGPPLPAEYRALRAPIAELPRFLLHSRFAVEASLQPIRPLSASTAPSYSAISWSFPMPWPGGALRRRSWALLDPPRSKADIDRLSAAVFAIAWRPVFETLRRLSAALPAETTLIGFRRRALDRRQLHDRGGGRQRFRQCQAHGLWRARLFGGLIDLLVGATVD